MSYSVCVHVHVCTFKKKIIQDIQHIIVHTCVHVYFINNLSFL